MVETRALSVSHSKFSFPTSVLSSSLFFPFSGTSRVDLELQSTMKFLHELFLGDRRPCFPTWRTSPGSVRANLADQTEAKSHAFVRVNSIHWLSTIPLFPPSLSLCPFRACTSLFLVLPTPRVSLSSFRFSTSFPLLQPFGAVSSAPPTTVPIDELATTVL